MKFDYAFIIGAGGTGSHLIEPLAKLLNYHPDGTPNITLIDGDSFEENNNVRQLFNPEFIGVNKAEATSRKFPWLNIQPVSSFVDGPLFLDFVAAATEDLNANLLIIMSVDNHATRKAIIESLEDSDYQNYTLISPGNAYSHGEVLVYQVLKDNAITANPLERYPNIANPQDRIPGAGCEVEAVSTPQLITANAFAALGALLTVSAMLDNKPWFEELHFNCEKMKMVSQGEAKGNQEEVKKTVEDKIVVKPEKKAIPVKAKSSKSTKVATKKKVATIKKSK